MMGCEENENSEKGGKEEEEEERRMEWGRGKRKPAKEGRREN